MGISEKVGEKAREFWMTVPGPELFTDVHNGTKIPNVLMKRIQEYLQSNEKEFEEKCKDMYEERYIRYVRQAKQGTTSFLKGQVWSEYPKSTSYTVDVRIDAFGVIEECQCTCTAGEGPSGHCKHIATLLYGLMIFSSTGDMLTEQTCTQRLQTFHHAKPYKGSPMKTSHLAMLRKKEWEFDPRPVQRRNMTGYPDLFRNKVLSFVDDRKMPVEMLYPPANPITTNFMHDYAGRSDDRFFQDNKLESITKEEKTRIEENTLGQVQNKEWMLQRQHRLTSSNFSRICKATSATNFHALARSFIHKKHFSSRATSHGIKYESVAVEAFERITGHKTVECGLFVDSTNPWLAASPDRLVDSNTILEVKCPFTAKDKMINPTNVPYVKFGDEGMTLCHDHQYYYQVQGQLMCTNHSRCLFIVFTLVDFKIIEIARDDQFITSMVKNLESFYKQYFRSALISKFVFKSYDRYFV